MARLDLQTTAVVPGGDAIARDDDGRVVFVEGAIPGERVVAEVTEDRRDFRRARTVDIVDASPDRIAPPCPNVALGCGGCGWQHVAVGAQRRLKESLVRDALTRIAKLDEHALPAIRTVELDAERFRTTVRVAVRGGRAHFHHARSNDLVAAGRCLVAHPLVAEVLDEGDFGSAREAVVRAGVATGERAALLMPSGARGARLPSDVAIDGAVHERVEGRVLRASIRSFFQSSPAAAGALVREVLAAIGTINVANPTVADLYAGVGLFAGAVGAAFEGSSVVAVERSRSSVADARVNLRDVDATVVAAEVARWRPSGTFDVVIADPARPGLGRPGVDAIVRAGPRTIGLVSCDAASFARDVALLAAAGWRLTGSSLVDAFPHTPHVEVVSLFDRSTSGE
jgi:23S rRNA (uracil1939-C5)-methyltransferase